MYCATIFDLEREEVTRFFWVSTLRRAARLVNRYAAIITKHGINAVAEIEYERYITPYSGE